MSICVSTNATHLTLVFRHGQEEQMLPLLQTFLFNHHFLLLGSDVSEEPFPLQAQEKCVTGALAVPLKAEQINWLARLVSAGQLLGFVVRGEIQLEKEDEQGEQAINSLKRTIARESGGMNIYAEQVHLTTLEDEEFPQRLSERDRYLLAIDTGTLEYYYADLRREAFRQDEEKGRDEEVSL